MAIKRPKPEEIVVNLRQVEVLMAHSSTKFNSMKIMITGGAGFIGSALVRLAIAQGHAVINLDALTYTSRVPPPTLITKRYVLLSPDILPMCSPTSSPLPA